MKKLIKEKEAITLIALVITIVILIILAGVLVSITLGNNGLFNKAKLGKELYANAQDYEDTQIAKTANEIDSYVGGNRQTIVISKDEYEKLKNGIRFPNYSQEPIETIDEKNTSWIATEDCVVIGHIWKDANTKKAIVEIDGVVVWTSNDTNSSTDLRDFPPMYVKKGSTITTREDSGNYYLLCYPLTNAN